MEALDSGFEVEIVAERLPPGGVSDDRKQRRLESGLDEREPAERSSESPSMAGGLGMAEPSPPPRGAPPARLGALTVGTSVAGVDPRGPVRVTQAHWHGADCLDLTYRDATGRTDSGLLYRDDVSDRRLLESPPHETRVMSPDAFARQHLPPARHSGS